MGEYNFMPRKNKKCKIKIDERMNKIIITFFLLAFTLLVYSCFRIFSMKSAQQQKIAMLEKESKQITIAKPLNSEDGKKAILMASAFLGDIDSLTKYSEVNITGNQIRCTFTLENEQEYCKLISRIEGCSKYKVKSISPLKSNSPGTSLAEVLLEVTAPQQ